MPIYVGANSILAGKRVLQCVAVCCVLSIYTYAHAGTVALVSGLRSNATLHTLNVGANSILSQVSVCCSVSQCIAVRCSVLQCVAVCCSVLQCVVVCRSVLQHVAVCHSVLQCVAARCSMFQVCRSVFQCVAMWCSTLPCVAVCCRVLQCVAYFEYGSQPYSFTGSNSHKFQYSFQRNLKRTNSLLRDLLLSFGEISQKSAHFEKFIKSRLSFHVVLYMKQRSDC